MRIFTKNQRSSDEKESAKAPVAEQMQPGSHGVRSITYLQRAAGNQAVQGLLQRKIDSVSSQGPEEEKKALKGDLTTGETPPQRADDEGATENRSGIPHPLKAGLELLSGINLSGIRIHNNSSKPAQLNALAYTQGQDIHVAPGQEKYLPHEGWHAAQQMQGRVKPTMQAKGVSVNDDGRLEREADVMGARALQLGPALESSRPAKPEPRQMSAPGAHPTVQRAMKFEFQTGNYVWQINKYEKSPRPIGAFEKKRKLGRKGFSEDGSKPTFLAVGRQGYPEVRVDRPRRRPDLVKARGAEIDKTKASQYIETFRVSRDPKGRFTLGDKRVTVTRVGDRVDNSKVKGMRGQYNPGTYEFTYLDGDNNDKEMDVHRDPTGNFQYGKIKRMRRAKKADIEEGTAIELQSEARGVIEFETPKWFRSWCALRLRIREAYEMTEAIKKSSEVADPKVRERMQAVIPRLIATGRRPKSLGKLRRIVEWPSKELPTDELGLLKRGGRLIVEIVDEGWKAKIQPSEGIPLTQYETLLAEHHPSGASRSKRYVDEILKGRKIDRERFPNLYGFLQMIGYYIERGQLQDLRKRDKDKKLILHKRGKRKGKPILNPAKYAFVLMSRTSFSSIFSSLLLGDEQILFEKLVTEKKIVPALNKLNPKLKKLGLTEESRFFRYGHGGGRGPTIHGWLESIIKPTRVKQTEHGRIKTDLLSHPYSGSAAMGRFEVETEPGQKDTKLVKFEFRGGLTIPAAGWEKYAERIFKKAAESRKRDDKTGLIYTESKDCANTYFEYQKEKAEKKKKKEKKRRAAGLPAAGAATEIDYDVVPKLTLKLGDEKKPGFEADFRLVFPSLLEGKLRPFLVGGIGTGGISAGGGGIVDPVANMGLFLAGKAAIRTDWFKSVEYGGGLEAAWAIDQSRSLRLGVGWDAWRKFGADEQWNHLANVFLSKRF